MRKVSMQVTDFNLFCWMYHIFSTGAAYVFKYWAGSWTFDAKLLGPDAFHNDEFGSAVALNDDTAFIGMHNDDSYGTHSGKTIFSQRLYAIIKNITVFKDPFTFIV